MFEDAAEARELCEHHGLTVTDDGLIHMGKTGFIDPETAFPPRRALQLINGKQTTSLGEVRVDFFYETRFSQVIESPRIFKFSF